MVHSRDVSRAVALTTGIAVSGFALARIIVCAVLVQQDSPHEYAWEQLNGLALANIIELLFDVCLVTGLFKEQPSYMKVWLYVFPCCLLINSGLCCGLIISYTDSNTLPITTTLCIYLGVQFFVSGFGLSVVLDHYHRLLHKLPRFNNYRIMSQFTLEETAKSVQEMRPGVTAIRT